jgi:transglutaminase-like putative cysteine protease
LRESAFDLGLYLRGPVYDRLRLDGFGRSVITEEWQPPAARMAPTEEMEGYEVFMQPLTGNTLFTLGPVVRAGVVAGGTNNPSVRRRIMPVGFHPELRTFRPLTGPTRIAVYGGIAHGIPRARPALADDTDLSAYLELPEGLDPRVAALARSVAGQGEIFTKVGRLRSFLRDGFTYSLDQANAAKTDPLVGFLFEDRRGHCEYFATAFAVMLRAVEVPSRVVGGFQGGFWDDSTGVALFTAANAHAWVEWYVPGHGWVTDDATPAALASGPRLLGLAVLWERMSRAWDDYVVEYSVATQWRIFTGVARNLFGSTGSSWHKIRWRRGALWVGATLAAAAALWIAKVVVRRWLRARRRREGHLTRALRAALERSRGEPLPLQMTFREGVEEASAEYRDILDPALEAYEQYRFAGAPLTATRVRSLVRSLSRVRG